MMLNTPVSRRSFTRWAAASPLALAASTKGWAAWDNVETPPVFSTIAPPALTPVAPAARLFAPGAVRLLDSPYLQAQGLNARYIRRLDTDRLLHNFRVNAGLPSSAKPLGGWEAPDCELRGHFVGHYLSGAALAFAATNDPEFKRRGDRVVAGLAECQTKLGSDGYLSAFPRSYFDRLAAGTNVWAPFYTIHKIFAGLLDMHELARSAQALDAAKGIANWTDNWTGARDEAAMQKVLEVEFGGMNDALYRLAAITGDRRWLAVGDRFTKKRVFEPLAGQKDELRGLHMNTHVPQVIGAERRYELTGDHRFADVSRFFWQTVTGVRTYATGGSSNNEHWLTEPHQLGVEWAASHDHQECCCSYNMLKLGTMLFTRDPQAAIADYYERALLNHRLGEIHPETGNTSYFLSLAPGAWKTWGTDETTFWCCNGTALEDFSSFNRMIYAHDANGVWVNLFIPSELNWSQGGVRLRQETGFPAEPRTSLLVEASGGEPWTLRLRVPAWARGVLVAVNGRPVDAMAEPGSYLEIRRRWRSGDRIEMQLPMEAGWESFEDRPDVAALTYGPVVLAQQFPLGEVPDELMHEQGPKLEKAPASGIPVALPRDLPSRLKPVPGKPLQFIAEADGRTLDLRPINDSWGRYSVYSQIA
jgi:DUF1680 family protein